ncbi:MAG: phosphopyruvate hydratase [Patescibacteria group bacterium]|nr:phosphopyruvate hydratase [Patescibacteria group bacterium]MDD5490347.1 phosphopyruvate hydratase [Patescibacteria group bacterium]
MKIKQIHAREILDSRGNPTISVKVILTDGTVGVASVPSGASTGVHEALELRDGDKKRYGGKGVLRAVNNVNKKIFPRLKGMNIINQREIDEKILKLDGTKNKSRLGANAILGVSLACAHAGANYKKQPLYRYIRGVYRLKYKGWKLPVPTMNIINGGKHADNNLSLQEFMIVPLGKKMKERVRVGAEIFQALKKILKSKKQVTAVGDEGGFAPNLKSNEAAFELIIQAIKKAGYKLGKDVATACDVAASEFHNDKTGGYRWDKADWNKTGKVRELFYKDLIAKYKAWPKKYGVISIEDGLAEDDWENWRKMTSQIGKKVILVGDDLFVTNSERLRQGIKTGVANAILIKVNQIGTLSETIDAIKLAQKHGYKTSISHRSGETADTTIADLAVAVNSEFIKTGSLSRSERVEKYNRLMEIEEELR